MRAIVGLVTACLGLVAPAVWGQQPDSAKGIAVELEVLQVQARRFQAMTDANIEELGTILADDLTYTHTTGQNETKAEFLSSLQSQKIKYESIDPKEVELRIYDSTAIVTGISAMRVSAGEQHFSFSIRFIEVLSLPFNHRARHAAILAYKWCRPPTRFNSTTLPFSIG